MGQTIEENAKCSCSKCGSSFNSMFLLGKQGNDNICPMCGGELKKQSEEDHPDWITWWYYKDPQYGDYSLWDKPPLKPEELELIKEFKAPPETAPGGLDEVKRILRTYVPDAFENPQKEEPKVRCPRCGSSKIELMPRRYSLLVGFATNKFDRVCVHCKKRF